MPDDSRRDAWRRNARRCACGRSLAQAARRRRAAPSPYSRNGFLAACSCLASRRRCGPRSSRGTHHMLGTGPNRRLAAADLTGGVFLATLAVAACTETLDAGHNDRPHGLLPVDERNPVILYQDDWSGDWLGEYAVLLANSGGPPLAGIVVNASKIWTDLNINTSGWRDLVTAASSSGLQNVPEVTPSAGAPLTMPANGQIDSTVANGSAGANLI